MPISVVIPAYNEAAHIGRLLHALTESPGAGPDIEVVVAPNGCVDNTAALARGYGVRVVEVPVASKPAALNAGDAAATGFPRIYLDADIIVSPQLVRELGTALAEPGIHAAVPRIDIDLAGCSWPVRAFYAINARLPVFRGRLFGRGVIALSQQARDRFGVFPDLIGDDLFLDAMVGAAEKREIGTAVRVPAPRRAGELVRRIARARAGNAEFQEWLRAAGPAATPADPVEGSRPWSWLRDVVLRSPRLVPAAACYVAVVVLAELRRRAPGWSARSGWGRAGARPA
jgi:glycosyltransferase involved in cell wall biosynthesis